MRNNINELLEKRDRTRYWLAKEIGISYAAMTKLANNQTESIKFETIENICNKLGCSLTELFTINM